VGRGQRGQDRDHHQHGHPAQLRTPPVRVQLWGRLVAPAGRHWPHRARPRIRSRRRPRRAGPRPWAAAWWRACSAWAWAAVVRQLLRQRHRRHRAWWGSRPRPRSSTRYGPGTAAAPARSRSVVAAKRPSVVSHLMLHHHRRGPGRPGCGGGADEPGRPRAAARLRPGRGGAGCGPGGPRPAGRTGNRTTAGRCGGGRTQRPAGPGHTAGNA
jgi:hypothetical protein